MHMPSRRRCRWSAFLLALACLVAAVGCGSTTGDREADGGTSTSVADDGGTDGTGPAGRSSSTTSRASGRTGTTRRAGGQEPTPSGPSGATPTSSRSGSVDTGARGGPGDYARWVLAARGASRSVTVELLVEPGAEPTQSTRDHLLGVLRESTAKPVTLAGPASLPAGDGTTTDDEIRALADRHATVAQTTERAVLRLLFLRGEYAADDSVLGVAVRGDTAAVFSDVVRVTAYPVMPRAALEDSVTTHEVGHLLGLVDLVLSTGRADPKHPGHSASEESVMYYAVESNLVLQALDGPPPRDFDNADRADLAALRNGA